jgi:hypothetical protein
MAKMKKEELKSLVLKEIERAAEITDISRDREDALDYYLGKPFGDEVDGKSQVVSTDVQETIEWIMPSIMRVFASTDRAVMFDPIDPTDEEAAKQESDIVNYVFYKENNGFLNLYSFFKDALMMKNGVLKFWWDDDKEEKREEYNGLTAEELALLLDNPNVEPIEYEEINGLFNIAVKVTNETGCVKVEPVPPEEFLVSDDATSPDVQQARFVCHHTLKTPGELVAMGISKRIVDSLPLHNSIDTPEAYARDTEGQLPYSTDKIRYDEAYMMVDFDNDGIDELRQIVIAGNKMISNEVTDYIPFASTTPIIMTHKYYGLSIADTVMDLQKIKSRILRDMLDNTYLANNPRHAVYSDMVNLDDLLTSRAGGIVRTEGPPQDFLMPLVSQPLPQETFQMWNELESIRKGRTGVGQDTMGLESNVLAHGRTGVVSQSFDMARMRIELIARVFAETGVKQLFMGIHKLLQQNQNKQKWAKLRGQWVQVSPTEWRDRYNMTVRVGLGSGNRDKQVEGAQLMLEIQKMLGETGSRLVTEENTYNTLEKLVEVLGFRDASMYFTDPSKLPPPQPPQPSPMEQAQLQLTQSQMQLANAQAQGVQNQILVQNKEADTNRQEAVWKHEEKLKELEDKDLRERTKLELEFEKNVPGALT